MVSINIYHLAEKEEMFRTNSDGLRYKYAFLIIYKYEDKNNWEPLFETTKNPKKIKNASQMI